MYVVRLIPGNHEKFKSFIEFWCRMIYSNYSNSNMNIMWITYLTKVNFSQELYTHKIQESVFIFYYNYLLTLIFFFKSIEYHCPKLLCPIRVSNYQNSKSYARFQVHFLSHYPDFLITSCSQCILHSWMGDIRSMILYGLSRAVAEVV